MFVNKINFLIFEFLDIFFDHLVTCFVSHRIISLMKKDHEARLRILEMSEEEQRNQVRQVVRQTTGDCICNRNYKLRPFST